MSEAKEGVRATYPQEPYDYYRAAVRAASLLPGYDNLPQPTPTDVGQGLCANLDPHEPHLHVGNSFPPFWCDPAKRPERSGSRHHQPTH